MIAAAPGVVAFAGQVAGRGVVSVDHPGGLRTTYEPLVVGVRRGQRVEQGAVLGRLADAGGHCLPGWCLHWGARRGTVYVDPMRLLRAGPVRLLPVWDAGLTGAGRRPGSQPEVPLRSLAATAPAQPPGSSDGPPPSAVAGAVAVLAPPVAAVALRRRARASPG